MVAAGSTWIETELGAVAAALGAFELHLVDSGADGERLALRRTITDYLLPRLDDPGAPLVAAVVGPSGSGKSTLLNSLAETKLAPTGPLRPTTRYPVAWTDEPLSRPFDAVRARLGGSTVTANRKALDGMVLVDTPPPDVTGPAGARPAADLLEAADLCVFVASASRYADASGWSLLEIVARRNIPAVFVLNRLPPDTGVQRLLLEDMARRLAGRGLVARPDPQLVLGIPEAPVIVNIGGLFPHEVEPLRKELASFADPHARRQITGGAVATALSDIEDRVAAVRDSAIDERRLQAGMAAMVGDAYGPAISRLRAAAEEGGIAALTGSHDLATGTLAGIVTREAGRSARTAAEVWELHPAGRAIVDGRPTIWSHGPATREAAESSLAEWLDSLDGLVLRGKGKRRMRRRRLRRLTAVVRSGALDGSWVPNRRQMRRLDGLDEAIIAARRDLGDRLVGVLAADSDRFISELGSPVPASAVDRLTPPGGTS